MKYLVIVESPAKCKKISDYLGEDYRVCATYGHFREIKSLKAIDNDFNITFTMSSGKQKYMKVLKDEIKNADEVILASDNDREGEAISWHVCDYFKLPVATTKRIIFNEITKSALTAAVANPTVLNMNIVNAQKARQVIDLMVGFKISPILWSYINRNAQLSAGRCQTPALKMVYDNHIEYQNQTPTTYYKTIGYFTDKSLACELNKQFDTADEVREFMLLSKTHEHTFTISDARSITTPPPLPFTTSKLQQAASSLLHCSPKETMNICQKLYESGHITYMRTDSTKYAIEFVKKMDTFVGLTYGTEFVNSDFRTLTSATKSKGAQEAHEAVRVTDITVESLSAKTCRKTSAMYTMIRNHTLKTCMSSSIFEELKMTVNAPMKYKYVYRTQRPIHLGWKVIEYTDVRDMFNYLRLLNPNQLLKLVSVTSTMCMGDTKSHLTEASLVSKLETMGIGRPSTFASIVDRLFHRKYVRIGDISGTSRMCENIQLTGDHDIVTNNVKQVFQGEKKKILLENMGIQVCEFLYKYYTELFRYEYTHDMEYKIDAIANNDHTYEEVCGSFKTTIQTVMKSQKTNLPKKEELVIENKYKCVDGKFGLVMVEIGGETPTVFHKVKPSITREYIKDHIDTIKYSDLLDTDSSTLMIGVYGGHDVLLKSGPYGKYIKHNGRNIPIPPGLKSKKMSDITLSTVMDLLNQPEGGGEIKDGSIIREFSKDISIRMGKYGPYIQYKTAKMKKPKFVSLKKVKGIDMSDLDKCVKGMTIEMVTKYCV